FGNWDDVVLISRKNPVPGAVPLATPMDKAFIIQRIPSKHTADSIGDKALNILGIISPADRYFLVFKLRCQFVLQAIQTDKDTVQFLFIRFKLAKPTHAALLPFQETVP